MLLRKKSLRLAAICGFLFIIGAAFTFKAPENVTGQTNFSVEYDTDRGGSDYKHFDLQDARHEACRDVCAGDPNCKAYTYSKPYQGNPAHCWLKSAVPAPVPYRSCCISGVKNSSFGGNDRMGPREDGTSLQGTNLSYYHRPAFETCQSDCVNNGKCKGFTWISPGTYAANDPAMCYLMAAVTGRSQARGHYSGVKQSQGAPPPPPPDSTATISWDQNAADLYLRGKNGQRFTYRCPASEMQNRIWGSGVYTDDSRICLAGLHAGVITRQGGTVMIEIMPGQSSYIGSTRNGVTSEGYGQFHGSYKFVW